MIHDSIAINLHQILLLIFVGATVVNQRTNRRVGPIFLNQLQCSGNETSLLDCRNNIPALGLTNCDHSDDVWIECKSNCPK